MVRSTDERLRRRRWTTFSTTETQTFAFPGESNQLLSLIQAEAELVPRYLSNDLSALGYLWKRGRSLTEAEMEPMGVGALHGSGASHPLYDLMLKGPGRMPTKLLNITTRKSPCAECKNRGCLHWSWVMATLFSLSKNGIEMQFVTNHVDCDKKLQQTMVEMFSLKLASATYNKISGMVSILGDCFTKIISPKIAVG